MPPDRVKMPRAPTFCFRSVFCTPAMTAPTAVVWRAVFHVFATASRGWKVACWAAMAGGFGGSVVLSARDVDEVAEVVVGLAAGSR
jgi:hypothetical protein